jgi:hypothetical protein
LFLANLAQDDTEMKDLAAAPPDVVILDSSKAGPSFVRNDESVG